MQFQEYQTTSPQIQQQQGILQHILPQIHQYNTNQITQQPNIKQEAAEQITLRNVSPLPPPPPGGFDLNSHFVRNVPIYESDPRYINKKINIQLNTPTQGVVTTQITPVIQTVNQIKTGPPVLNNATPVLNQVGVTQLNNISPGINIGTGVNQIGTGVTAVNNVTSGLNQVNTGLTGINKIENEVNPVGSELHNLTNGINTGITTGLNDISSGLNIVQIQNNAGINNLTGNLDTLQSKITSDLNAGANSGLNNLTPNLVTLQNQITTPNVLNTF